MVETKVIINTYRDEDATPKWIATTSSVESLLAISSMKKAPEFASGGETEKEAVMSLMLKNDLTWECVELDSNKESAKILNLHKVREMLRKSVQRSHHTTDLLVLLCLFSHHPRKVKMSIVKDETSLARQTAYRALNDKSNLIDVDSVCLDSKKPKIGSNMAVSYSLTPAGVQSCVDYLRMLI